MVKTRFDPARRWSPSMFWVTSVKRVPERAAPASTSAAWPALGWASRQTPNR